MKRKNKLNEYIKSYKSRLFNLFEIMKIDDLEKVIASIVGAFRNGKTLYIAGNGGSAATASHMQADFCFFVRYFTEFRPKVVALTDSIPMITAVGNDNSFDDIFVEQLKGRFEKGDVLLAISASGNSRNVIKAAEFANEHGGISIAFVGFKGGKLKEISQIPLYTPNAEKDYGPIEDLHMILNHLIISYLSIDEEFLSISN